ncbi:MAG: STT3 domain-containing protein [Promethearchaeota archaeon]
MVKILNSLRNFRDRLRISISIKTTNFLFFSAILLLVALAIIIRCSPLIRGINLIKAFDPWIQWYNAEYLSTHSIYEYFNWVDTKSWYPQGFYRGGLRPGLTFTVVTIYNIFRFIGVPVSLYNICFYFPAFMGGITTLVMYFLGKEVHNRGTGLLAAFFLAFNPGYLQRTTAGFFDNETIGVFATLMTFLFFLKAIRTGKFSFSVIGGIFLGYLSLSWGGYQFVYLVIPIICFLLILLNKYNENVLMAYAGVQGTGILIFSLYTKFSYQSLMTSLDLGGIFLLTIILTIFHIIHIKKNEHPNFYKNLVSGIKWILIPAILIFGVLIWVAPEILPFGFGARFWTILNPLFRENIAIVASVAEQMPSPWSVFYYNTLIPLILVPLGVYFGMKRLNAADILLITFITLMYYFTGSMIRIILIFAPAAALAGAYGLTSVLKIFGSFLKEGKVGVSRKRKRQLKGTLGASETFAVYIVVGFLCISQVVHTTDIAINQMSYAQMQPGGFLHDWEASLTWMKNNLQGTDVVVSWWDYGYWLTPVGNVTTVNDNATKNETRIGMTGMALMQSNEIYSAKVFRMLKADYVLVYFGFLYTGLGGDEGKWTWMTDICNDNYATYLRWGMEEDNWADNNVFDVNEYRNATTGQPEARWFQSQLVKLMFWGEPTSTESITSDPTGVQQNYVRGINNRELSDGSKWIDYIPKDGDYDSLVFTPIYISQFGLVKLFKIDYSVLDSSFTIKDAEVFDNGYASFKLKNTGTKDLLITDVTINNETYSFSMSNKTKILRDGHEELVWVNMEDANLQKDDIVKIDVSARSEEFSGGKNYDFTNYTNNFFVKGPVEGNIKINKENSIVIQKDASSVDIYLEVENKGDSISVLDRFYTNDDTPQSWLNETTYLSGSSILEPNTKANILISDVDISFNPIKTSNKIGVATPNNVYDELLFTSNVENYSLSILSEDRIQSPEVLAFINNNYRKHIPIDFENSYAYTYDNGTTILNIKIKNTGDIIFALDSVYLTESLAEVDFNDFETKSGSLSLETFEEDTIFIDATNYVSGDVNEEILVCITGIHGTTVSSDIGYIHTIKDEPDLQVITNVEGYTSSYIYANETGKLLIKNTGNEIINIENIYVNNTLVSNITYSYGDSSLDIQECAIATFDIPSLKINETNECFIRITTNTTAEINTTLNAFVDSVYYEIEIDDGGTTAINPGILTILINNNGLLNVTVDSVYINNTFISLDAFNEQFFEIASSDSLELTINIAVIGTKIGTINDGDDLVILVRTIEGAEDTHTEIII